MIIKGTYVFFEEDLLESIPRELTKRIDTRKLQQQLKRTPL